MVNEQEKKFVYQVVKDPKGRVDHVVFPSETTEDYYGIPLFVVPVNPVYPLFDIEYLFPCLEAGKTIEASLCQFESVGAQRYFLGNPLGRLEFTIFDGLYFRYNGKDQDEALSGTRLAVLVPQGRTLALVEELAVSNGFVLVGKTHNFPPS